MRRVGALREPGVRASDSSRDVPSTREALHPKCTPESRLDCKISPDVHVVGNNTPVHQAKPSLRAATMCQYRDAGRLGTRTSRVIRRSRIQGPCEPSQSVRCPGMPRRPYRSDSVHRVPPRSVGLEYLGMVGFAVRIDIIYGPLPSHPS